MKKIIAIAVLFLAFSSNANAQEQKTVKGYKIVVITPESVTKDHAAFTKAVTMNESLQNDMMTLLKMRMESVNGAREEDKKAIFERYSAKMLSGLTPEQLNQFKSNKELYLKLIEY